MIKTVKVSEFFTIVKPEYVFLKLTPNNSIRNNNSYKIAKTINSIYKNARENMKKDKAKLFKVLGKEFMFGTKYSFHVNSKVSYYVYLEKKKAEFYFIIPKQHLSIIKEKIRDVWQNVTINEVNEVPTFSDQATKLQLVYTQEDALSLAVDRRDNDLLNSQFNIIDVLEEGDRVGIFYNFMPISQFSWHSTFKNTIQKAKEGKPTERNKMGFNYLFKSLVSLLNVFSKDVGEAFAGVSDSAKLDQNIGAFTQALERINSKNLISDATIKKGSDTVLNSQILVMSESSNQLRQRNNAKSLAQSFDTISQDNNLISKPYKKPFNPIHYSMSSEVCKIGTHEAGNFISLAGRDILEAYNFIEKVETQETEVPEDLRKGVMCIGENTFRGKKQHAYLSTDKEYQNLTLVLVGPTRAGKSTLIGNLSKDGISNNETTIIFDFIKNNELSDEVAALFPKDKVLEIRTNDTKNLQGLGYNEFKPTADPFFQYDNAKKQTTQLMTLINSINTDDKTLAPKMERYLSAAALIVFIQNGSFKNVFDILQDHKKRIVFLKNVPGTQKENLEEYILSLQELDEVDNKSGQIVGTKFHLITGIIDRLQKLKQNAYMELMLKKGTEGNIDLVKEIQKPQLITIKMPEVMFMTKNEKDIYTTYWITKIWLALQIRGQELERDKMTKVNIIIDELYQVENTERFITEKISQIAKFNGKVIISAHYINQLKHLREELRSANASYMLISGCDKKNYQEFQEELYPFKKEDLLNLPRYHSLNIIKNNEGYARFITKLPKPIT